MKELVVEFNPAEITGNFETIKAELKAEMKPYEGMKVSVDNEKDAKATRAYLKKIMKSFDERRIEIKNVYMQPYDQFAGLVKELTAIIENPWKNLDDQIKELEKQHKVEKEKECRGIYKDNIGDYEDFIPFERVFKKQWLNAGYKAKDIRFDISEAVTKVKSDLEVIKGLNSKITDNLIDIYKTTGNNLQSAIKCHTDYVQAEERVKEQLKKEEAVVKVAQVKAPEEDQITTGKFKVTTADVDRATFTIYGKENIKTVVDFLEAEWIKYERG